MKNIISRITMKRVSTVFLDKVTNNNVYEYIDCFGDLYISDGRFGLRIKK